MEKQVQAYFSKLHDLICNVSCTSKSGSRLNRAEAFDAAAVLAGDAVAAGRKLIFIGNGGSAGIASHMAIDFSNNGKMRALALNDGAALTCLANDFGYEEVFAKQLRFHAVRGDVLVAISSSGRSRSILNAVNAANEIGCSVITYSGFDAENPLRAMGDVNFYVASHEYGMVEIGHAALIHALADLKVAGVLASERKVLAPA